MSGPDLLNDKLSMPQYIQHALVEREYENCKNKKKSKQKHSPCIWKTVKLESHIAVTGLRSAAPSPGSVCLPWAASLGWEALPCPVSSPDPSEVDIAEGLSSVLLQW